MDEAEEPAGPWGPGIANIEAARARCCISISNKSPSCCLLTCEQNVRRGFKFVPRSEPEFLPGSVACPACSNKYTSAIKKAAAKAEAPAKRTRSDITMQEDMSQKSPKLDRTQSRTPLSVQSSSTETPSATARDERPPSARELDSSALIAGLQRELADKNSLVVQQDRVIKEQGKTIKAIRLLLSTEPDETVLASLRIAASSLSVDD
eukprot:jgi/Chrpa1/19827/Chrysochromulina_OHIO_Genome00028131-RA